VNRDRSTQTAEYGNGEPNQVKHIYSTSCKLLWNTYH